MAQRDLLWSGRRGKVGVEADEVEVVKRLLRVALDKGARVAVEKTSEVEVRDVVPGTILVDDDCDGN